MINFRYDINNLKHNKTEVPPFNLVRKKGTSDYLLLLFKSNGELTVGKRVFVYKPNDVIILRPKTPHAINTLDNVLTHDYIHFNTNDPNGFIKSDIKFNELFHCVLASTVSDFIQIAENEVINQNDDAESVINNVMNLMLTFINRSSSLSKEFSHNELQIKKQFDEIRNQLYFKNEFPQTIKEMANKLCLSESRFAHLYKRFFNISPKQDIIMAKIQFAKQLLLTTDLSIKDIAFKCSFQSEYVFIRCFKNKIGVPPGKWR